MVGDNCLVIFPPAAQDKGFRYLYAIHIKGHGKLVSQNRFNAQQFQHPHIGSGFIGALGRQTTFPRIAVHPVRLHCITVADLHMGFVERHTVRRTHKATQPILIYERIGFYLIKLFVSQILKGPMRPASCLSEVGLLDGMVDG